MVTEELTARQELAEVAQEYRKNNEIKSAAEKNVEKFKEAFLDLVTEVVEEEMSLPILTLPMPDEDLATWIKREYPGYVLVSKDDESMTVFIKEDPKLVKYEFEADGFRFGRTVAKVGASFNSSGLFDAIQEIAKTEGDEAVNAILDCFTEKTITVQEYDEKKAAEAKLQHPALVYWFEKFTNPGSLQVRMMPVKAVKQEEA